MTAPPPIPKRPARSPVTTPAPITATASHASSPSGAPITLPGICRCKPSSAPARSALARGLAVSAPHPWKAAHRRPPPWAAGRSGRPRRQDTAAAAGAEAGRRAGRRRAGRDHVPQPAPPAGPASSARLVNGPRPGTRPATRWRSKGPPTRARSRPAPPPRAAGIRLPGWAAGPAMPGSRGGFLASKPQISRLRKPFRRWRFRINHNPSNFRPKSVINRKVGCGKNGALNITSSNYRQFWRRFYLK